MNIENQIFYQIFPFGFCGAPQENDKIITPRIRKIFDWIPHLQKIGVTAVYFCPVFSSDKHGYDTRDYKRLDERLGANADFADVCRGLHDAGMSIVLDGVFNHVGRGFWAFQDVLENRQNSQYASWFHIDWNSNSSFNDGFDYRGWEKHQNLVALNHENPDVTHYLFDCISFWQNEFGIDGIRLDVAYCLPDHFIQKLRAFCGNLFLVGEIIHGDYNRLLGTNKLHSVTNYQLHKSLWSSFNDANMFEAAYTLEQHFGIAAGAYKGAPLLNFVDNHDVNRSASVIKNPAHLKPLYALLFSAPGIPCLYYGSEWGAQGARDALSDDALRPFFEAPQQNELTEYIGRLSILRKEHARTFTYGTYKQLACIYGGQLVFERIGFFEGNKQERIIVAINAAGQEYFFNYNLGTNAAVELISGNTYSNLSNGFAIPPYTVLYLKV